MVARLIYSKMWSDEFFTSLTAVEKVIFVYFLTNEAVNIINLYERPERVILFDTGVTAKELENAKNRMQAQNKIYFYKDFVYIANAHRYQEFTGDSNKKARQRLFSRLPIDVLDWYYSLPDTPQTPPRQSLYSYPYKEGLVGEEEKIDIDPKDVEKHAKTLAKN